MKDDSMTPPVLAALVAVYFFWGTTYLGMKFAIETLPPFIMLGLRFTVAGAIMFAWEWVRLRPRITLGQWRGMGMVGALMLLGGTGGVAWSEQVVPSNIAAVVVATVPLWIAVIRWVFLRHDRPERVTIVGLLTGFAGIIMLVVYTSGPSAAEGYGLGLVVLGFSTFLWSAGSLYSRAADQPDSPALGISMQMLVGGLLNLIVGILCNGGSMVPLAEVSMRSAVALAYLVVFGSIVGFSSYIWLLKKTDPALASSYAYVNPVVAIILGWLLAGERLNTRSLAATTVILFGVILIVRGTVRPPARSS